MSWLSHIGSYCWCLNSLVTKRENLKLKKSLKAKIDQTRFTNFERRKTTKIMQKSYVFVQNFEDYAKICEKLEIMRKVGNYAILCENLEIMRFSHNSHNRIIHGALPINTSFNIGQVWGTIVKPFEQIFQLFQLHLLCVA